MVEGVKVWWSDGCLQWHENISCQQCIQNTDFEGAVPEQIRLQDKSNQPHDWFVRTEWIPMLLS